MFFQKIIIKPFLSFIRVHPMLLLKLSMLILFLLIIMLPLKNIQESFQNTKHFTVCLDAGHGGGDPGKVSSSGVLEKDINLILAKKCKLLLEKNGISVIMTREEDCSLSPSSAHPKTDDLKKRKEIMNSDGIDCVVSIHQNSYPDESQHGAQVFYPAGDSDSKRLASLLQEQLRYITLKENHRKIKENSDYFLLRDSGVPIVIAEVCFLSNPSEAALITEVPIQDRAAFGIAMGIMQFLNKL